MTCEAAFTGEASKGVGGFPGSMGIGERGKNIYIKRGILKETAPSGGKRRCETRRKAKGRFGDLGLDFRVAVDDDDDDDGRALSSLDLPCT